MIKRRPARRPANHRPTTSGRFAERNRSRRLGHETLEKRELLAADLLAIRPDNSGLLQDGDVLNVAPREFNLFFNGGANLNEATINANTVRLVRSGGDGVFDNGDDIVVSLGYVGLVNPGTTDPSERQQIVMRPASSASWNATNESFAFPDDFYRIEIIGAGSQPLRSIGGAPFGGGQNVAINFRLDRGAQVVSVVPQPVTRNANGSLTQEADQIVVYFDNQLLNAQDAEDPKFFRLVNTQATLASDDDQTLLPQSADYDPANNRVTLKFAAPIPEGTYRLDIGLSDGGTETIQTAIRVGSLFNQNRFTHNGFLGDINGRNDDATDLDHYRFELAENSTIRVDLTAHGPAVNLRARLLDSTGNPIASVITGPGGTITLTHTITATGSYYVEVASNAGATGSYLIDVSVSNRALNVNDNNSTFSTATDLGNLGAAGLTLASQIEHQTIPLPPWAGGQDEPGHRQIQREIHIPLLPGTVPASGTEPRLPAEVIVQEYQFPLSFQNQNSPGEVFLNQITEEEKRIVRTIFDVIASYSGYVFVETANRGLRIGKTDLRAFEPSMPAGAGVDGLGGGSGAIVNAASFQDSDRFYGDGFTGVMFHEIGHAVGLWHSYDLPSVMGAGVPEDILPGDHDIVHLQRLVPPNSTDIDMFRFELAETGRLSVETIAQRLPTPSLLDTALKLYRQDPVTGNRELIARNNRYFGNDSFIELDLGPGVYFVGVSSTGNENYDPNVPNSGYGGTTDGAYELKLSFKGERGGALRDADGTPIDGNSDGTPGGVHQFWFQASDTASTIFVDRNNDPLLPGGTGGTGAINNPFDRLSKAVDAAGSRIVVPLDALDRIVAGDSFTVNDGINNRLFTFDTNDGVMVSRFGLTTAEDLAVAIATAINNANPLNTNAVASGRIVNLTNLDRLDVSGTPTLLNAPNLIRIVGNGGSDNDLATPANNRPYLLGTDTSGNPLRDGAEFLVPQGVTVMVDEGVLIKMRAANLDAGTSAVGLSRAASAIQVLGTPTAPVWLRSLHDDTMGGNSDGVGPAPNRGDFGGIVFRGDSDLEDQGIFLNHVTHIDVRHGGGRVFVDSQQLVFAPIHLEDARPTIRFNHIHGNADSAISANPNSFEDSLGRIGPDIVGNFLRQNTIDGLFIRIRTEQGATIDRLTLPGRFNNTDITHVLTENLIIAGNPGGALDSGGQLVARAAGRLVVDPGIVLKINDARIEAERGNSSVIAEGTANRPVVFTSLRDDRYGGSGSFDTDSSGFSMGRAADWAGIYLGILASGNIDHAILSFGGGVSAIEGVTTNFNVIEAHQATLRVTNSLIRDNASGNATGVRNGRGANQAAAIYVRSGQPIIVNNTFINNDGAVVNINVNSLNHHIKPDPGRATGTVDVFQQFADNHGPLVRLNRLSGNATNGMLVRPGELTTEGIWDDTDIVHVLQGEIRVDNHHTYSGLRLQSSNSESLVIKLAGANAGFTATGTPLDIIDRVGGTIHVLGQPGFPVVMTHIADDTVGAGFTPDGRVATNTNNSPSPSVGTIGGWRGLRFDEWSNDRNVAIIRESENPITAGKDVNRTPTTAQQIGTLAPNEKSGDENRRLGFEIHGFISPDDPRDMDVYSFRGTAGTPIWIDIDRTDTTLDAIVEVINANGTVLARSVRSGEINNSGNLNVQPLTQNPLLGGDYYTQNFRDPGMRYVLPGTAGVEGTYFIRVRSNPQTLQITDLTGVSTGKYQLQIRLRQVDEFPGSTVRFADIRNAVTAIDVRGLPARSPFIAEAGEVPGQGNTFGTALRLVNLLQTDMAAIGISGELSSETDVDWYRFSVEHTGVQVISGVNDDPGTVAVVFDLDYADALNRADTTIAVYDPNGVLIWVGRESNIEDDQPLDATGSVSDLSRGSIGRKDPYIGPIHIRPTVTTPGQPLPTYYVAVMSNRQMPAELTGVFTSSTANASVRLEPVNTTRRIVEDHFGFQGYDSNGERVEPEVANGIFDLTNITTLAQHAIPFDLSDVVTFISTDTPGDDPNDNLYTASIRQSQDFLTRLRQNVGDGRNDLQDIVIRSDGAMFGYRRLENGDNSVGQLVRIDPNIVGSPPSLFASEQNDNIRGDGTTPNVNFYNPASVSNRAQQFTTSNDVDAVTFRRLGDSGGANPVPSYNVFYSVRESATTSKLYRARGNGDATPTNGTGLNETRYGYLGHIQFPGVTNANTTLTIFDGANPPLSSTIRFLSKLPGNRGNAVRLNITYVQTGTGPRAEVTNASTPASTPNEVNPFVNLTIRYTRDGNGIVNGGPTAGQIADAINTNANSRELMMAVVDGGETGTGMRNMLASGMTVVNPLSGGTEGPLGTISGRVTGLAFDNFLSQGNLFGVTNAGEFLEINPNTGAVLNRRMIFNAAGNPFNFQGLALGPQNVSDGVLLTNQGIYRNTLFAITASGEVVALDSQGNPVYAFESNNGSQRLTVTGNPTQGSFFTLTFDNGVTRQTTEPIAADAPDSASVNERQTISTNAYAGTFTLSYEKNQGAVSSLLNPITTAPLPLTTEVIEVQNVSDQPFTAQWPATPFVIRVQNEEMLVTARTANDFTVRRGFHGTTPTTHPDTASVYEVISTLLETPLLESPTSVLTRSELLTVSSPMTLSSPLAAEINSAAVLLPVDDATVFPLAPFTVRVNNEQMLVSNVNLTTHRITVNRAEAGTTAVTHPQGSHVQVLPPATGVIQAINTSAPALRVFNAAAFPTAPFVIRVNNEQMLVNSVDLVTNQLNVTRGHNSTTPTAHNVGASVRVLPVAAATAGASINELVTTLEVVNAGNFPFASPTAPFVVRINSEEMLVTNRNLGANTLTVTRGHNGTSATSHTIGSPVQILPAAGSTFVAINATQTSIRVLDASTFPPAPFSIRINDEIMRVTLVDLDLDELVVDRGQFGSSATAHNLGSRVDVLVGSAALTDTIANLSTATTLRVNDASVFPLVPFTVRVNREEMLVSVVNTTNNELTVVRGRNGTAIETHHAPRLATVVSDSITVATTAPFPTATPYNIRIGQEDLRVVSRTGNQLDVIRGFNGTSRAAHAVGERVRYIETTGGIQFNANAASVANALRGLPSIQIDDIVVSPLDGPLTGTAAGTVTIEFAQNLGRKNLLPLTADTSRLRANEVRQIVLGPEIDSGDFTLTYAGQTTDPIPFNAGSVAVRDALEALPNVGRGNVIVTGGPFPGNPMTVEFTETLGNQNLVSPLSISNTDLRNNERQQLRITGGPTGGNFRLVYNGTPTADIAWNADAALVRQRLEAITAIGAGNVSVTGSNMPGGTMQIEFVGNLADQDVSTLTFANAFTGGTAPTVVITVLEEGDIQATTSTVIDGSLVSVPIVTAVDGVRSIRDSLVGLSTIENADIAVSGSLQGGGVVIQFANGLGGTDWTALDVDNFEMTNGVANIAIDGRPGDGIPDAFVSRVTGMTGAPTGIAFSPLDFNLWHPTTKRSSNPGHGINAAPDGSRFPNLTPAPEFVIGGQGSNRQFSEGIGGISMHFGFEQWVLGSNQTPSTEAYLPMNPGANTQLGILNTVQHRDLSSNAEIVNTYNFPGGALGSLVSSSFSLADATRNDRPTLYFNYFLATQNHLGSNASSDISDPFRDSARVFASRDGGPWELLATNNSELSGANPNVDGSRAELPGFLSHLSDAALNSETPRLESHQIVQELFDNTGQWRQARIDLSTFRGVSDVRLRFDFSTAGAMDDASLGGIDSTFGEFRSTTRSIRSMDNRHEGFYIDDIIVGFAERGEMVTGVVTPRNVPTDLATLGARTADRDPARFANPLTGRYQLEIRRVDDVATWVEGVGIALDNTFDTNARHINSTFDVTATQGFETAAIASTALPPNAELAALIEQATGTPVSPLLVPNLNNLVRSWGRTGVGAITGNQSLASPGNYVGLGFGAVYQATPMSIDPNQSPNNLIPDSRGLIRFKYSVSSLENVHGLLFLIDGVPQLLVPGTPAGEGGVPTAPSPLASGDRRDVVVEFPFERRDSTLTWIYLYAEDQALATGANRAWIDDIEILQGDRATGLEADRNRHRPQGMFIIESNTITNSQTRGINVQPGETEGASSVPHPGSTINFPNLNNERLIPGVVIQNNIISGSSGIAFSGESTIAPQRPVPFGRIVNNTLVGNNAGVGIQVGPNASPTILNNIVTRFATGIINGGVSTEIRSNYFQANGPGGVTGDDPIVVTPANAPLFLNDSFYLVQGSLAVDSSLNTLQDRFNFVNFKTQLGIPASPIFAPDLDVYGQKRVDSGQSPGGGGTSVFKDRGAVDRSDFDAPFAVLLAPIDNDISGLDRDPNDSVVLLNSPVFQAFSILLADGRGPNSPFEGTGVNALTVSPAVVTVRRNNVVLTEGVDYVLGFNASTSEMRLTPLSTLWNPSGVYEITLDNDVIADRAGNLLRSNQPDGSTRFWIILPDVDFDFGDASDSFGTLLGDNGPRHALINGAMPRLGRRVDSESDAEILLGSSDDTSRDMTAVVEQGHGRLSVISNGPELAVVVNSMPSIRDAIRINDGRGEAVFELVPNTLAPRVGNVAVRFDPLNDSVRTVAGKLAEAIQSRFNSVGDSSVVTVDKSLELRNQATSQHSITVALPSNAIGGSFDLAFANDPAGISAGSVPINSNASAEQVQTALQLIGGLAGNVTVTGGPLPLEPVTIVFGGALTGRELLDPTIDSSGLIASPASIVVNTLSGAGRSFEVELSGNVTGGTFTLSLGNPSTGTTVDIPYDADALTILAALEALDGLAGRVAVTRTTVNSPLIRIDLLLNLADSSLVLTANSADLTVDPVVALLDTEVFQPQQVMIDVAATVAAGSYRLRLVDAAIGVNAETSPIAFDAAPGAVQAALEAIVGTNGNSQPLLGNVDVTAGANPGEYVVTFINNLSGVPVAAFAVVDNLQTSIRLENLDDEDGVGVSTLNISGTDYIVFSRPNDSQYPTYEDSISSNSAVLGFLNPLEPAGTFVPFTVQGSGFIDAWIDFNGNGVFETEFGEKVLDSVRVVDGLNTFRIHTPVGTSSGTRWMRVRLSPEGGLDPTGLAVGGEVEDYRVEILPVAPVVAANDLFVVDEDTQITDTVAAALPIAALPGFVPYQIVIVDEPTNGEMFEFDSVTGVFTYRPLPDFAGIDTFTYYVALQQSAIDTDITVTLPNIVTVTIDVRPVNDAPLAPSQRFVTRESQPVPAIGDPPQVGRGQNPLTITAADLVDGAIADANPQYPIVAPEAPWNEGNQSLRVVEVIMTEDRNLLGGAVFNSLQADPVTGLLEVDLIHGKAILRFAVTDGPTGFIDSAGSLIHIDYVSHDYLNRDNVELISVDRGDGTAVSVFEFFRFTIEDDGVLIDPQRVDSQGNIETHVVHPAPPVRLRHTAFAAIDVAPQNDYPIPSLASENLISVGRPGAGVLLADGSVGATDLLTPWSLFHKPVLATLTANIDDTDLFLTVDDTAGLPAIPFNVLINAEVMTVTQVDQTSGQLAVQRGIAGTTVTDHFAGAFVRLDLDVPVPTEDSQLFIPAQFLLQSDFVGQLLSTDESRGFNDGDLRIIEVAMVTAPASGGGSVSLDVNGNVLFTAPTDLYGEVVFTYVIEDTGIDEDVAGDRVEYRLTATGTVTVVVQPVNDNPIAYERALQFVESGDPVRDTFIITPADFLIGAAPEIPAIPGTETTGLDDVFAEREQTSTLRVVAFGTTAGTVDVRDLTPTNQNATVVVPYSGPGTGSGTLTLASDAGGHFEFDFEDGALTQARFITATDYNRRTPFNPVELLTFVIEDNGRTTDPQDPTRFVFLPAERSAPQTLTITIQPTNDAPEFPVFDMVVFPEDIRGVGGTIHYDIYNVDGNVSALLTSNDPAVHGLAQRIFPSFDTARDERVRESLTFTVTTLHEPTNMFAAPPVIDVYGVLTLQPNPHVFGYSVFELTATDNGQSYDFDPASPTFGQLINDFRSTSRTVTIFITPVNDIPVSVDREVEVIEAEEFTDIANIATGDVARYDFTPADFLGGTAANPVLSLPSGFSDGDGADWSAGEVEYDEDEQDLRVVQFTVINSAGNAVVIDAANFNGVEITLATGRVTFHFDDVAAGGAFTHGVYFPSVDYNQRTPFVDREQFTYVIEDFGATTIPGADFVNLANSLDYTATPDPNNSGAVYNRSVPRTMTIRVRAQNDAPEFPVFNMVVFPEDIRGVGGTVHYDIYNVGGNVSALLPSNDPAAHGLPQRIFPSRSTALDERVRESLTFTVTTLHEPTNMFAAPPVIDVYGVLTLQPNPHVFGYSVFELTATDNGQSYDFDPASPTFGQMVNDFRSTSRTVTIFITPVNDIPVSVDREVEVIEAEEFTDVTNIATGDVARYDFTPADFLGGTAANPVLSLPSGFSDGDGADWSAGEVEYDEDEQDLRVVQFTVTLLNGNQLVIDAENFNGVEITLVTGRIRFHFDDIATGGAFTHGVYFPNVDYNEQALPPLPDAERFTYVIEDFGATTIPGADFVNLANSLDYTATPDPNNSGAVYNRSVPRTMAIRVRAANDAPIFDFESVVNILERDDNGITVVPAWATNIFPGPLTALDELARQTVSFSFVVGDSIVPTGLFRQDPLVNPNGTLSLFPAPDAVGTAIIVMRATDFEDTVGFVPRSTDATFTVNVQPVNDVPRRDASQFGTSAQLDQDTRWEITSNGTIVYTLRENNAQPGGTTDVDFFIPLSSLNVINAYNQIGLLDVILVGPANEADGTPGGSQTLTLSQFPALTQRGGRLTLATVDGRQGLNYRPPLNFNFANGGLDSFTYTVIDNGQTYVLGASPFVDGTLVDDFLTTTGQVQFRINSVNNRPEFTLPVSYVESAEDSGVVTVAGFATNIVAGPATAPDELTGPAAQTVRFELNPLDFTRGSANDPFGAGYPAITSFGMLTFRPLPDVFGIFRFEVFAIDSGSGDIGRGDLNTSLPQTITVQIQPINDAPRLIANPVPLFYEILEDRAIDLPINGLGIDLGLLDNFVVGPPNEAASIHPELGGNQTLELIVPFPPVTAQNGALVPIRDANGTLTHLRYTPRQHFVGIDTFTFVAFDNGVTVDVGTGGVGRPDPLSIMGSVTINVLPVNDPPQFFGGGNVSSTEDQGLVTIQNWATGIHAGPSGANDERAGVVTGLPMVAPQTMEFIITRVLTEGVTEFDPLFLPGFEPVATIVGNNARLAYRTAPDAHGIAVFEVVLRDSGLNDPVRGDINSTVPRIFTITVGAVNDPPQFTAGPIITIDEVDQDGVEFTFAWAQDILPGPLTAIDEIATQTVSFDVTTPAGSVALFETDGLPSIDDAGVLTFTPARFAAGQAVVQVVAVDSQGARSAPISLTINITDINNVPVASDIVLESDEDNPLRIVPSQLLNLVFDPDLISNPGEVLTIIDVEGTTSLAGASITVSPDGRIVYDPLTSQTLQQLAPGQTFRDHFTYRVQDAVGAISNLATVFVDVAGINDAPVATSFTVLAATGEEIIISLLDHGRTFDIDGTIDPASIFITRQPTNGILVVRPDGTLSYTPFGNFQGQDFIGYTIADNLGQQSTQETITIDVAQSADAQDELIGSWLVAPVTIDVNQSVTPADVALDLSSIEIVTPPRHGTATPAPDGTITYVAETGFSGTDSFQYRIYDIQGRPSSLATVTVQIVASPAQNPILFRDVNADGIVEPFDALLILTRFAQAQQQGISGSLPAEMVAGEAPMRFYDVDGNGLVEPLDALLVLLQIAEQNRNRGLGEGESVGWTDPVMVAGFTTTTGTQTTMAELRREAEHVFELASEPVSGPVQSFDWEDDDFELLAVGVAETREEKQSESDTDLLDAVWGDLF